MYKKNIFRTIRRPHLGSGTQEETSILLFLQQFTEKI